MENFYENYGAQSQPARRICPYCGNSKNSADAAYCGACGRKLSKTGNKTVLWVVIAVLAIFVATAVLIACHATISARRAEPAAAEPAVKTGWEDNVLRSDEVPGYLLYHDNNPFAMGSSVERKVIRSITFLDTLKDAPADSWDVSEQQNGSVRAWIDKADLYIGANGGINAKYCHSLFYGYRNVSEINFNNCFHTDYAVRMNSMFASCNALCELDVSDFNTANVTDMNRMFYNCAALTSLTVGGFSTSNVTDMRLMFSQCPNLETVNGIEHFDTRNVTEFEEFMESGKLVNGHPWEDMFPLSEGQNKTAPAKETRFRNIPEKGALISLLEDYQSKYGDSYVESFYRNGDAAFLADLDGDGTDELVLNEWVDGDEDHDGYPDEVVIYCVYDYQDGAWQLCKESDAIGSVSFPGNSGQTHCVYKDGKAILAVREWRSPYGTSGGPGLDETATVTFYDNITQEIDIIEVKTVKVGYYDDDNTPIMTDVIRTYKINDIAASYDQFIRKLSEYEGISYILEGDDGYFSFDNWSGKMPSDLIRELRES